MTQGRRARSAATGLVAATAAGALLLMASPPASANHVGEARYYGTFGDGGTIELGVSEDETTVSVDADAMPGTSGMTPCGLLGSGPDDFPVTNHSYSFNQGNPGASGNGDFSTYGIVTGAHQIAIGSCTSGFDSFTATIPADGLIGRSSDASLRGDGVYGRNGKNQTRKWTAERGQTRSFEVRVTNDGPDTTPAVADGCSSSAGFKVTYEENGVDVTTEVVAGLYQDTLLPNDSIVLDMQIKAKGGVNVGKTKSCKFGGEIDNTRDVVRAQLKVKRD